MDDAFSIFDAPPSASDTEPDAKRGKFLSSPVLPLCQRFVQAHVQSVTADLMACKMEVSARIAKDLKDAVELFAGGDSALDESRRAAENAAQSAWAIMSDPSAPLSHRPLAKEAYVLAHIILCGACASLDDQPARALRSLDHAFIFGGLTDVYRDCAELLDQPVADATEGASDSPVTATSMPPPPPIGTTTILPVERHACPGTVEEFRALKRPGAPLLLEGVGAGWPAMRKWADMSWLKRQFGARLVPVEIGSLDGRKQSAQGESAGAAGWGERIMSLSAFIDAFLSGEGATTPELTSGDVTVSRPIEAVVSDGSGDGDGDGRGAAPGGAAGGGGDDATTARSGIGYLAQHPLFEQLPRLRHDFAVPPLCAAGRLQHTNAWLGPAGTVTPLHFDSYDNVLTQVFGYKRVRLYEASQTHLLYPKEGGGGGIDAQGNVSAVDVEAPDLEAHPEFARAVGTEAILGPGDGLFIPAGCWHHVRSLTPAFSISFWF